MNGVDLRDRSRGMMLGLAIGDALGSPAEFLSLGQIKERYGPNGVSDYVKDKAMFTDDTQMSIAVAEALLEAGRLPITGLMDAVTRKFVEWHDSPDNFRAPGIATMQACRRMKEGTSWMLSGDKQSKGCGSVMRSAPVGFYYRDALPRLKDAAHVIGICTHKNPTADAACQGTAFAAALAIDGTPPAQWPGRIMAFTKGLSEEFTATIHRVESAAAMADEEKAVSFIGRFFHGWTADEVLGIALYSVMRHPEDFSACVLRSINNSGDSDSIGCVAGALQGARLGVAAIPGKWVQGIERRGDLEALADRLAAGAPPVTQTAL
ncbi:MAG: ADP-ribosylglycohydrolase family protein [Elusimicrobia bacterium]|nr:ADP-ribosylglycohydrolase family protein [Elusimicrobiota bacterium]